MKQIILNCQASNEEVTEIVLSANLVLAAAPGLFDIPFSIDKELPLSHFIIIVGHTHTDRKLIGYRFQEIPLATENLDQP